MKIKNKLIITNNIAFLLIIVGISLFLYFQLRSFLQDNINNELQTKNKSIVEMIKTTTDATIKTHLRTIAEKNRELVELFYAKATQGEMTEEQAYEEVRAILLDPQYGKLGETGYLAGVTTQGVLTIHPKSPGVDASGFEFMQEAMAMKNGYLEYMWKNKGEETERAKAGWLSYFEPWDIMVWASSYKSEFTSLINPQDFEETILQMSFGESGYAYIMDSDGNLIIHPEQEGENIYNSRDSNGRYFIREICEKKNGIISYPWQNEGEDKIGRAHV